MFWIGKIRQKLLPWSETMIIQTGMRTDIPAFHSQWLLNRIEALLPGGSLPGDTIHQASQISWLDPQLRLEF